MKPTFNKSVVITIDFSHLEPDILEFLKDYIQKSEYKNDIKFYVSDEVGEKYYGAFTVLSLEASDYLERCLKSICD